MRGYVPGFDANCSNWCSEGNFRTLVSTQGRCTWTSVQEKRVVFFMPPVTQGSRCCSIFQGKGQIRIAVKMVFGPLLAGDCLRMNIH